MMMMQDAVKEHYKEEDKPNEVHFLNQQQNK
jgi:hypothetical protein